MINGLNIYYSKKIGKGLRPISTNTNNKQRKGSGLKPISKGRGCKKVGSGLKILQ